MNIAVRSVLIGTTYKKAGTSELHSTLIVLVITIIAGAAVFGFANSQASVTEKAYGNSVNTYVKQLQERYSIVNIAINYPSSNKITIWLYNYGDIDTRITQLYIGTSPSTLSNAPSLSLPLTVSKGSSASITIDYITSSGQVYYVKAVGEQGNTQISFQGA
ncbi:MAG: hypothetical protein FJ358_04725 [Thaumarchaeota archaeon]|nr:hypothetical protein [Nitrososphaerota archaeon]